MKMKFMGLVLMMGLRAFAGVPVAWDIRLNDSSSSSITSPYEVEAMEGETLDFMPRYMDRGRKIEIASNAFIRAYFREYGTTNSFVSSAATGTVYTTSRDRGRIKIIIHPSDLPALTNQFYIGMNNDGMTYRAWGKLSLQDAPGINPTTNTHGRTVIDWSIVDNINMDESPFENQAAELAVISNLIADVQSVVYTNKPTKLWGNAIKYVDGDLVKWKIITYPQGAYVVTGATVRTKLISSVWAYNADQSYSVPMMSVSTYTNSLYNSLVFQSEGGWEFDTNYRCSSFVFDDVPLVNTTNAADVIYMHRISSVTNVIDKAVGTNGTVIIIGYLRSDSGTVTGEISRSGSVISTNYFINPEGYYTQSEVNSMIDEIPRVPTNAYSGLLFHDLGTNVWMQLAPSNLDWEVWEVEP